jgi:hypothetical protein
VKEIKACVQTKQVQIPNPIFIVVGDDDDDDGWMDVLHPKYTCQ